MKDGWVKIHRMMLDHPIMDDDWLCRLWVWCLLKANTKPSRFKNETLAPGQFVTGRTAAAEQLHVSPSKWYRGMQKLVEIGCIKAEANSYWTTVTICKWETYQSRKEPARTASEQPADSERTTNEQPADTEEERKNLRKKELNTGFRGEAKPEEQKPIQEPPPFAAERHSFDPLMIAIPDVLRVPRFLEAWAKWHRYLTVEKETRFAQGTAEAQLISMARDGPIVAIQRIEASIEAGWIKLADKPQDKPQGGKPKRKFITAAESVGSEFEKRF